MKTRRFTLSLIAVSALGIVLVCTHSAEAGSPWGDEFRIGRGAVQVGHGHGRYAGSRHHSRRAFGRGHYDWHDTSHYDWHDTSHYDYVPGGYQRHGRHYHYVPGGWRLHRDGHYDLHQEGHYDFHRGGHHRRRFRH